MIYEHNGIAISFYDLKALKTELSAEGGYLIFEFNNALIRREELESGRWVDCSYRNEPVSQYYDNGLELKQSFDIWIKAWSDFIMEKIK